MNIDYKAIVQSLTDGYAYHEIKLDDEGIPIDYIFLEVNPAFEKYTGLKSADIIGKTVTQVLPEIKDGDIDWIAEYGEVAGKGTEKEFKGYSVPLKRYYKVKAYSPQKGYFITLFNDVTTLDEKEEKARKTQEKYKKLFENLTSGCAIYKIINDGKYGKDYIIEAFNKKSLEIENMSEEEVIGKSLLDLRPNIDDYGLIDTFRQVWKTGKSLTFPSKQYIDDNYSNYYENRVFRLSEDTIVALYNDVTDYMTTQNELKNQKEKLERYINEAPYGVFIADANGDYLKINNEACKMTGYSEKELLKMNIGDITYEEDEQKAINNFNKTKKNGISSVALRYVTKNKEIKYWQVKAVKLDDTRYLGFTEDITEKINLEKEEKLKREETKSLFDNAGLGIEYFDVEGKAKWFNNIAAQIMNGKPEDFVGKSFYDMYPEKEADKYMARLKKAIETDSPAEYIDHLRLPVGDVWFKSTYNKICDSGNKVLGVEIISNDVTDIKMYELELEKSRAKYKSLFESSGLAMGYYKLDGTIVSLNKVSATNFGGVPEDFVGKSLYDYLPKSNRKIYEQRIRDAAASDEPRVFESLIPLPKGDTWFSSTYRRIINAQGEVLGVQIASIDINKQKTAEIELKEINAFLQAAFDHSQAGIAIADAPEGRIRYVNKAGLLISDKSEEELVKKVDYHKYVSSWNIMHLDGTPYKEEEVPLARAVLFGEDVEEEFIIRRNNLEDRYVLANAAPIKDSDNNIIAGIVVFLDITEKKRLEEEKDILEAQAINTQKLESIGTLASGVAHEINNPINGILNYGQIIKDISKKDSDAYKFANEIIHETNRVSEIVKNLLDFSRKSGATHSYARIEDIISKTLSLINTIFRHDDITLNLKIPDDIPQIKCRSQQVQQVIMNLLTNARDSLNKKYPEHNENKIINLYCSEFVKDQRKWISITVEDFGVGISDNIKEKIFDPFFTTKGKDKGTGLGLFISYGIIQEHHGDIEVISEKLKSTKFIITLPCDNGWDISKEK